LAVALRGQVVASTVTWTIDFSEVIGGVHAFGKKLTDVLVERMVKHLREVKIPYVIDYLKKEGHIVGEQLIKGFRVEVQRTPFAVKFVISNDAPHALFLHTGSRPHTPPYMRIYNWLKQKEPWKDRATLIKDTGAIWNAISEKGTKPHPFLHLLLPDNSDLRVVCNAMQVEKEVGEVEVIIIPEYRRYKRSIITMIRSFLYQQGRILGDLQAIGIDAGAIRSEIYRAARTLGDVSGFVGSRAVKRIVSRVGGRFSGLGLAHSIDTSMHLGEMDKVSRRMIRRGAGHFAGIEIRKLLR